MTHWCVPQAGSRKVCQVPSLLESRLTGHPKGSHVANSIGKLFRKKCTKITRRRCLRLVCRRMRAGQAVPVSRIIGIALSCRLPMTDRVIDVPAVQGCSNKLSTQRAVCGAATVGPVVQHRVLDFSNIFSPRQNTLAPNTNTAANFGSPSAPSMHLVFLVETCNQAL